MAGLFIAADHRGFQKKAKLLATIRKLENFPFEVIDAGAYTLDPEDDYNDVSVLVARSVLRNFGSFGVLLCGSAHGISIQANRFKGVRAIAGFTPELARLGREHNNANILCLSADLLSDEEIFQIMQAFLETPFSAATRHARRNHRLDEDYHL